MNKWRWCMPLNYRPVGMAVIKIIFPCSEMMDFVLLNLNNSVRCNALLSPLSG